MTLRERFFDLASTVDHGKVSQLQALGLEVIGVVLARADPVSFERIDVTPACSRPARFFGLFVMRRTRRDAEVAQDAGREIVAAAVGLEAEREVRLDRVVALVLELIRADLVAEADAAALLHEVDEHAAAFAARCARARRRAARGSRSAGCPCTSPVKHDECTRVSTPAPVTSPSTIATCSSCAEPDRGRAEPAGLSRPVHDHAKLAVRGGQPGVGIPRKHAGWACMAGSLRGLSIATWLTMVGRVMAVRPTVVWPDPRLREPTVAITTVDDSVRALYRDLVRLDVRRERPRHGSAAARRPPQDVHRRAQARRPRRDRSAGVPDEPPRSSRPRDEMQDSEEGCLSFPDIYIKVKRPMRCKVRAMGLDGQTVRDRGRRPDGALPAARERSPDRQAARRLRRPAQAPDDQEEAAEGQGRRRRRSRSVRTTRA